MTQTIFVRPGARRPYVPYGYLKDTRAERDSLADAIEEYLLWEPGRAGHAAASAALVAALRTVRPSRGVPRYYPKENA